MSNLDIIRGRQVVLPLTNKSGAQRIEGEVVVADVTTDDSFTTIAGAGSILVIGVVAETIANNVEGRVICGGYVPTLDVDAATVRGDYLKTSAVAGDATPVAAMDAGVFGIALSAVGGAGSVSAYLFGVDSGAGAAGGAWTLIQDTELGAPAANIDFLAIAGTYKHLVILYSLRSDRAAQVLDVVYLRFNNSAVGYDWTGHIIGSGGLSAVGGLNATSIANIAYVPAINSPAGDFGGGAIWVHDYADTSKLPSAEQHGGVLYDRVANQIKTSQFYGQHRTTAAVSRITLFPVNGPNFVAGSRACLYGIN